MAFRNTSMTIRPDFRKHTEWTIAEAAEYAGVKPATIRKWKQRKKAGQELFRTGFRVGPLRIDALSFMAFLRSGKARGE